MMRSADAARNAAQAACFCITGPTASGKTALALELSKWCDGEVVSMDSAIVYRGMDIGTDKPDVATRRSVPHHLVDIRDPEDTYSAGAFARDACAAVEAINKRGRIAIIVGGTLLYLRALREGLASLPQGDAAIRAEIEADAAQRGWAELHADLAKVDPAAAARIEPADRQRIQRALEVYRVSGRGISDLQRTAAAGAAIDVPTIALIPDDRAQLRASIAARFDRMVARGFVDEVRTLRQRPGLSAGSPSMRSVGYRQIWSYLDGEVGWDAARQGAVIATGRLAKRQLTWLRGDTRSWRLDGEHDSRLAASKLLLERVFG